jgi:putative SOS response-associated peptidase YedK
MTEARVERLFERAGEVLERQQQPSWMQDPLLNPFPPDEKLELLKDLRAELRAISEHLEAIQRDMP